MKILFYPNKPIPGQRVYHFLDHLNIDWTNDPDDDGITHVHYFDYSNRVDDLPTELDKFVGNVKIINYDLRNIKKDFIDDVFNDVFGYSVRLDPTTHRGMCGIKSSQNAIHSLKMIECPIKPHMIDTAPRFSKSGEPHYRIYVKLIDTRVTPDTLRDWRVVVMGYKPVYLFEKHIDVTCLAHVAKGKKFKTYGHTDLSVHFSEEEIDNIQAFILKAGYEFGEMDILRDNSTGLPYIVDFNPVAAGGVFNSMDNGDEAIRYLSNKYYETYLNN
jgi:hypothetical protein